MRDSTRAKILLVAAVIALGWLFYVSVERDFFSPSADELAASEANATGVATGAPSGAADESADAGVAMPPVSPAVRPIALTAARVIEDAAGAANGALSGRVVAHGSGAPVGGAELTFAHGGATLSATSGADGAFSLTPDEPGVYTLALITRDGFLPFAPEWGHSPIRFHARPGVRVEGVRLALTEAVQYAVRVESEEGAPVAGATVRVFGAASGERALAPMEASFVTDEAGQVAVRAPDGAVLEARHDEEGTGRAHLGPGASATRAVRIVLSRTPNAELDGGHSIDGRVVDADGAPVEGALVAAVHLTPPGMELSRLHPQLSATSDADGRFVLEGLDRGRYALFAQAAGFARAEVRPVSADATDVEVRLEPEARVRVRAVDDETGEPVSALTVIVDRRLGELETERLAVASAYDDRGVAEVAGLPEGACRVRVSAPGYALTDPIDAEATAEPRTIEARLVRGGTIRGAVTSVDGRPLAGARVSVEQGVASTDGPVPVLDSARTEADGRFTLRGVAPGVHSVVVWAEGHHGRVRSGLTVAPGGAPLELEPIDLTPVAPGETPRIELAGVGAVLSAAGGTMVVRQTIEGGGAAEVGVTRGDAIVEVDGVPVSGLGFGGTIERIRGPEGTWVSLLVRRADGEEVLLRVPRRRIRA